MIVAGRELILQQGFLQALLNLEKWAGQHNARKGRELVKRVVDFACDTVAPFPFSFPGFSFPTAPDRALRRAVMGRQYALIYEVQETKLVFIYVYSTYQNLNSLELPEAE